MSSKLGRNPFQKSAAAAGKTARSARPTASASGAKRVVKTKARTRAQRAPRRAASDGVIEALLSALRDLVEQMLMQMASAVRRWAT